MATNKHYVPLVMEYNKEPDRNDWISVKLVELHKLIVNSPMKMVNGKNETSRNRVKVWQIIQMYEDTKHISKKTLEYANKMYRRYNTWLKNTKRNQW